MKPSFAEGRYVCSVLKDFVTGSKPSRLSHDLNWALLDIILKRNRLVPLFFSILPKHVIPAEYRDEWIRISAQSLFEYHHAAQATLEFFRILESEGIPALALRGIALAERLYSDPALRPMSDVDIQIHSRASGILVDRLRRHGLTPSSMLRSQIVYNFKNTKFEVHWSFLTPKRYRYEWDFDQWLRNPASSPVGGGEVPCLKPEDELISLATHAFIHHELDRALPVVDMALVIMGSEIDWSYIHEWCARSSMTKLMRFVLSYTDWMLGLMISDDLREAGLWPRRQMHSAYRAYHDRMFMADGWGPYFRRKINLVSVAETPIRTCRQLLRLCSVRELKEIKIMQTMAIRRIQCTEE